MLSSTLLRVKRRRSQDPVEALQLSSTPSKKAKLQKDEEQAKVTFALALTLEKGHSNDKRRLEKAFDVSFPPQKPLDPKKRPSSGLKAKMREAKAKSDQTRRYQLLQSHKKVEGYESETEDGHACKRLKLVDIVEQGTRPEPETTSITCNGVEMKREILDPEGEKEEDFVFDVYRLYKDFNKDTQADLDSFFEDDMTIESYYRVTEDFYGYREQDDDDDLFEDDSDSNDEDNWRNDYPDEEHYDDYIRDNGSDDDYGFDDLHVGDDTEQSLIHSISFERDADLHGEGYARYKQKILREFDDLQEDNIDNLDEFD